VLFVVGVMVSLFLFLSDELVNKIVNLVHFSGYRTLLVEGKSDLFIDNYLTVAAKINK